MKNGIKFFKVIWQGPDGGFDESTEAAHSRRYLVDQIRKGDVQYTDDHERSWRMIKIQECETPLIEIEWLTNLFITGGKKSDRDAHAEQAAYITRLVETCAARVMFEDGRVIER